MNSTATWTWTGIVALVMAGVGVKLAVDACRPRGTDLEQIQSIVRTGTDAANRQDPAGIGKVISPNYRDSLGMSKPSLQYEINDFFRRHGAVRVTVSEESIRVSMQPDGTTATVTFHASIAAPSGDNSGSLEIDPALKVAKERVHYYLFFPGEEWKVVSAENYGGMEGL